MGLDYLFDTAFEDGHSKELKPMSYYLEEESDIDVLEKKIKETEKEIAMLSELPGLQEHEYIKVGDAYYKLKEYHSKDCLDYYYVKGKRLPREKAEEIRYKLEDKNRRVMIIFNYSDGLWGITMHDHLESAKFSLECYRRELQVVNYIQNNYVDITE